MNLLRFITAGSVDDGKSTLIGRLLYDSKSIFEDQLEAIEKTSKRKGEEQVNLALLTDGLKAEREQGITIDVAYRYFATPKRKFIIADTPGHIQYTRNMVSGASNADLALILIDARHGVLEQTIRHSYITSLLQLKQIVVCINKMDLVGFDESVYNSIKSAYLEVAKKLHINKVDFIPISAKFGDNIVHASNNMSWYTGKPLLTYLEEIETDGDIVNHNFRFPVQYVIRPQTEEFHDFRGYAGTLQGSGMQTGDTVVVLPNKLKSKINSIHKYTETIENANAGEAIVVTLNDDLDISRGDMLVPADDLPYIEQNITLMICWFNERPMQIGGKYLVRHTTNEVRCMVQDVMYKMDINQLIENMHDKHIGMNDIAKVSIKTSKPLFFDSYQENRFTGSLIFIDEVTNETVGAGMIL